MKKLLLMALIGVITITSCSKQEEEEIENPETPAARFETELVGDDDLEILKDTETELVWVNDIRGCFAGIITPEAQCQNLTFAGRDDWRTPTADEMSNLILGVVDNEIELNYINTSCALMSTSEEVWVFTENSTMPGETTTAMPGNAGLRCVISN